MVTKLSRDIWKNKTVYFRCYNVKSPRTYFYTFILDTDASHRSIAAELSQIQDGVEKTISFASKVLTPQQRKYCTTRKELLAIVVFTRQFRHYLLGRSFILRTDHNSLIWLMNFKNIQGQLARWLEELAQYNMVIQHRSGKKHQNADALSRIPETHYHCVMSTNQMFH